MATSPTQKLAKLQSQIAALQAQADAVKKKEAAGVIASIKQAIAHYSLTAADLGLDDAPRRGRKPGPKAATAPAAPSGKKRGRKAAGSKRKAGAIRYRDEAGNAWTGQGRRPKWFLDAIAAGKKPEDLAAK